MRATNRTILIILIILLNFNLFSQIEKGDSEFGFNFNGFMTSSSKGIYPIEIETTDIIINPGLSYNYYLKENLYIGLSVNYTSSNSHTISTAFLYNDSTVHEVILSQNSNILNFSPKIGFNKQLLKNFYFKNSINLNIGFSSISSSSSHLYAKILSIPEYYDLININQSGSKSEKSTNQYLYASLSWTPEFQYYFNERFGLTLGFGNIEFGKVFGGSYLMGFAFHPISWKLGFNLKI